MGETEEESSGNVLCSTGWLGSSNGSLVLLKQEERCQGVPSWATRLSGLTAYEENKKETQKVAAGLCGPKAEKE
jgi:hypothetical protein